MESACKCWHSMSDLWVWEIMSPYSNQQSQWCEIHILTSEKITCLVQVLTVHGLCSDNSEILHSCGIWGKILSWQCTWSVMTCTEHGSFLDWYLACMTWYMYYFIMLQLLRSQGKLCFWISPKKSYISISAADSVNNESWIVQLG